MTVWIYIYICSYYIHQLNDKLSSYYICFYITTTWIISCSCRNKLDLQDNTGQKYDRCTLPARLLLRTCNETIEDANQFSYSFHIVDATSVPSDKFVRNYLLRWYKSKRTFIAATLENFNFHKSKIVYWPERKNKLLMFLVSLLTTQLTYDWSHPEMPRYVIVNARNILSATEVYVH